MAISLRIDFVSDVVCPWCALGLHSLEAALARIPEIHARIDFHPFELNPDMPAEGQNIVEHIGLKFGIPPAQSADNRRMISERAERLGFMMDSSDERRVYNSFHTHRLLFAAREEGRQLALKHALFRAYFSDLQNISDPEILLNAACEAGMNETRAQFVIQGIGFGEEVRAAERHWIARGIRSVPAIVIENKYLLSGAQSPEAFEQALRGILVETTAMTRP